MIEAKTVVKLVVVGDADVGKTSIVTRYASGSFNDDLKPTVGAACTEKEITFDGAEYLLSMWDTAGQETYRNLVPMYFRNAQIAFIVFDVTNTKSAKSVSEWMETVNQNCSPSTILILVANKCDLPNRKVDSDEIAKIADEYKIPYVETSAKTGLGILKLFENAFSEFVQRGKQPEQSPASIVKKKEGGCC